MRKFAFWVVPVFFFLAARPVYANHVAGNLQWPFNVNQAWPCGASKYTRSQYFMEWYQTKQAYHSGEDWNGAGCGTYEDKGAALYALANGVVQYANADGSDVPSIGKVLIVHYTLPDDTQVDSVYYHLDSVAVTQGATVLKGQQIATIGDSYGNYPSHLHWEIRRDLTLAPRSPGYYNPLTVATALKYTNPSLFVDDRARLYPTSLSQSAWTYFSVPYNAPSSTAYISYQTLNLSLKKAADLGVVYQYVYVYDNGWKYYPDITKVFFQPGKTYAVYAYYSGSTLNVLLPGDQYRGDRARQDMLRTAQKDNRLTSVRTETYGENLTWDPSYERRQMGFASSKGVSIVTLYQATDKSNPLNRFTGYYDPETGLWTGWMQIDWNQLD